MERLPTFMTSAIQNACEQFRNITYTIHGENDKARISIVFTNDDNPKVNENQIQQLDVITKVYGNIMKTSTVKQL